MKKFLVYLCSIVVAVILGGVIGNLCAGIAPLSWLDYAPPLHLKSHTWNLYVADLTFGIQSKFNIAQLLLTIVAIFVGAEDRTADRQKSNKAQDGTGQFRYSAAWRLALLHTAFVIFAVIIALKLVDFSQYDRILNSQKKPKKKIATLLFSWYNRRGLMQKAAAAQESAAVCIRAENFMQPDTLHRIFRQQCSLFYGEKCRNRRFPAQFLEPVTEIFRKSYERNDLLGDNDAACRTASKGAYIMFTKDIGIDLGTANTLVYLRGKGIIIREPSVVAVNTHTDRAKYVGKEAKEVIGRTPGSIVAVRPLKDGVIADFETTTILLQEFIRKAMHGKMFARARVIICIPSGVTAVERRAVRDAADQAGAKPVLIVEEPMAAAIGAGLPTTEPTGCMVLDIGGGTSEVAVISLGGIVVSQSVRCAGDEFDAAIINYIKKRYNLLIGERTAESIKIQIGSAYPVDRDETMQIKGRNLMSGLPENINITSREVRSTRRAAVPGSWTCQVYPGTDTAGAGG